jgi:hypothetical protein
MRCARIGWPLFMLLTLSVALFEKGIPWAEYFIWLFGCIFIIYAWMTFDWFGLGYFQLFPVKWTEYDKKQQDQIIQNV